MKYYSDETRRTRPGAEVGEQTRNINMVMNAISTLRRDLAGLGGPTGFGGARDYNKVLGYPGELAFEDYYRMYDRHPVGRRAVEIPAEDTWRDPPDIMDGVEGRDDAKDNTPFVADIALLDERVDFWAAIEEADIAAGIGHYGVLYLGLPGDPTEPYQPQDGAADPTTLAYMWAFDEGEAEVKETEKDRKSPRYGLPTLYKIDFNRTKSTQGKVPSETPSAIEVHWTRCVHITEGRRTSRYLGQSRIHPIYNELIDLIKVVGGNSEATWRQVYRGIIASTKDGYALPADSDEVSELEQTIEDFVHDLRRFALLEGIDLKEMGGQAVDVSHQFEILMSLIALQTGVPKRLLMGSEIGKLASSQDAFNWAGRITTRRQKHAMPRVLRPALTQLWQRGVINAPSTGRFYANWKPIFALDPIQQAEVAQRYGAALQHYTGGKAGSGVLVVPPSVFRKVLTPFPKVLSDEEQAEAEEMRDILTDMQDGGVEQQTPQIGGDDIGDEMNDPSL